MGFLWWTTHSGRAQFVANHNTGGMWSRTRASPPAKRNKLSSYSRLRQQVAQVQESSSAEQAPQEEHIKQDQEGSENGAGTKRFETNGSNESHDKPAGTVANPNPTIFVTRSVVGAGLTPAVSNPASSP